MKIEQDIFKAYDIRGTYPDQINKDIAFAVGVAYAQFLRPKKIIVGRDVRNSGPELLSGLVAGLESEDVEITIISRPITTEVIYFATAHYKFDGGIVISASHNPAEYNGFKLCRENAIPISGDTGIKDIQEIANTVLLPDDLPDIKPKEIEVLDDYLSFLKDHFLKKSISSFNIVANGNFGMQGKHLQKLAAYADLPLNVTYLNTEPDGSFPKGRPDPMIPSSREETSALIKEKKVDFGVAWDADADRCFFYDHEGNYIDPYYINALFYDFVLKQNSKHKLLQDSRLRWLAEGIVEKKGQKLILSRSGHAFIKDKMRQENIYFGAEITAHYYFKDFYFADNGLIPLLWMLQLLTLNKKSLASLVKAYKESFYKVDEMLYKVSSMDKVMDALEKKYQKGKKDYIDGLSVTYKDWRFSARGSNTEPLLKVNLETRKNDILKDKEQELHGVIVGAGGKRVKT